MRNAAVLGVGMTKFGKFIERSLKDLGREAVENALTDVGISKEQIQAAYVGSLRSRYRDRAALYTRAGHSKSDGDRRYSDNEY